MTPRVEEGLMNWHVTDLPNSKVCHVKEIRIQAVNRMLISVFISFMSHARLICGCVMFLKFSI